MTPSLLAYSSSGTELSSCIDAWLADDRGKGSDDSVVAQSGGRSVRQLREAPVDDE